MFGTGIRSTTFTPFRDIDNALKSECVRVTKKGNLGWCRKCVKNHVEISTVQSYELCPAITRIKFEGGGEAR